MGSSPSPLKSPHYALLAVTRIFSICSPYWKFSRGQHLTTLSCQASFLVPTPSIPGHRNKTSFSLFHIAIFKPFLVLLPHKFQPLWKSCFPTLSLATLSNNVSAARVSLSTGISTIIFYGINTHLDFFWSFVFLTCQAPVIFFFF